MFGFSVATLGDIDGDQHSEFVVGAHRGPFPFDTSDDIEAPWVGRVYLYLSTDFLSWPLAPPVIAGACKAGCQVCNSSFTFESGALSPEGCSFPGFHSAIPMASAILEPPAAATLDESREYFGFSLCNAGDFDGDGVDDFAIGAPHDDNRSNDVIGTAIAPGRCYIISGTKLHQATLGPGPESLVVGDGLDFNGSPTDNLLVADLKPQDCNFGAGNGDRLGHALDGGTDVNGDGRSDLIAGAPQYRWIPWDTGMKRYAVTSNEAGQVHVLAGFTGSAFSASESASISGSWYVPSTTYPNPEPNSPDYGEAFGFSVSLRVPSLTPPASDSWDFVVGAPLFSDTPATSRLADPPPVDGNLVSLPDWGDPALPAILVGRSYGRATVWSWPNTAAAAPLSPPTMADWHYQGFTSQELVGWSVKVIGEFDSEAGQEIAINSRNFSTNSRAAMDACLTPCFQERDDQASIFSSLCSAPSTCPQVTFRDLGDNDAGTGICGAVTLHRAETGETLAEIQGEDPKDSMGWGLARINDPQFGSGSRLVLGAGRWPGNNPDNTIIGVGSVNSLNENGRVYLFAPSTLFPAAQ